MGRLPTKGLGLALALALGVASPALPQATTTRTQVGTDTNAYITSNGRNQITGALLRSILTELLGASVTFADLEPQPVTATSTTLSASQCSISLTNASAAQTVTLPAAASAACPVFIKDGAGVANLYTRTILPAGSDTIDGTWTSSNGGVGLFFPYASMTLVPPPPGGTNWSIE